jgi:glyoxylase-like metal-dependent hydrolase (beta-lactamase superfamily II)
MIFTQHYLDCLSQASYLIGDETTGRAIVVDPRRDIDEYLDEAAEHGLHIERVIETHIHADFLSGHLELAAATGASISYGVSRTRIGRNYGLLIGASFFEPLWYCRERSHVCHE